MAWNSGKFDVPVINSNLMVVMFQFDVYKFHFSCLHATKIFKAHAKFGI